MNFFKKFLDKDDPKNITHLHRVLGTNIHKDLLLEEEEEIFFGCGCFWGAEKCFWKLPGIVTTSVGYAGGDTKNPSYNEVCSGLTGHSEVVKVVWEPKIIDISDLLKMFWECHNPTQKNRQGNDIGSQYRSAIYFKNDSHKEIILSSKKAYQELLDNNNLGVITTEIKQIEEYFFAEEYHQQYLALPGSRQYCSASPTQVELKEFEGSNFKLEPKIWENFDWSIEKCVLRSDNNQISI